MGKIIPGNFIDGLGNQCENTYRGHEHDKIHQFYYHIIQTFKEIQNRFPFIFWNLDQSNSNKNGNKNNLKHIPVTGCRRKEIAGHHIHYGLQRSAALDLLSISCSRCGIFFISLLEFLLHLVWDFVTRLKHINRDQSNRDGNSGSAHIDSNSFSTDPAKFFQIGQRCHTSNQRSQNQWNCDQF